MDMHAARREARKILASASDVVRQNIWDGTYSEPDARRVDQALGDLERFLLGEPSRRRRPRPAPRGSVPLPLAEK